MGKNLVMLRTFRKVLKDNPAEIHKVIPDMYCKNFYNIAVDVLLEKGINKLIIDIDGTILPPDDIRVPLSLKKKFKEIVESGIKVCLVSNNGPRRVIPVVEELNLGTNYLYEAKKPLPEAFDNALKVLESTNKKEIGMIGDQMLSDMKGAKEYGLYTILVRPVTDKNNIQTATSRYLQNIMEDHLRKKGLFDRDIYYDDYNQLKKQLKR